MQAAAIPAVGSGDVLLASHTGSGKTLAYLLPLVRETADPTEQWQELAHRSQQSAHTARCLQIEKLKQQEDQQGLAGKPKRPRALVLGPTRELTDQILRVAKGLSHHAKFRAVCVNGGVRLPLAGSSLILHATLGKRARARARFPRVGRPALAGPQIMSPATCMRPSPQGLDTWSGWQEKAASCSALVCVCRAQPRSAEGRTCQAGGPDHRHPTEDRAARRGRQPLLWRRTGAGPPSRVGGGQGAVALGEAWLSCGATCKWSCTLGRARPWCRVWPGADKQQARKGPLHHAGTGLRTCTAPLS